MAIPRVFLLFLVAYITSSLGYEVLDTSDTRLAREGELSRAGMSLAEDVGYWLAPVFTLSFGVLADRMRRRTMLVAGNLIAAALLAALAAAWLFDVLAVPQLIVTAAAMSMLLDLMLVGEDAYLPALLARRRLIRANATLYVAEVPVALLGALVKALFLPFLMLAGIGALLASALTIARTAEGPAVPSAGVWRSFLDGLRFTARHRVLRAITLSLVAIAVLDGIALDLPKGYAQVSFDLEPSFMSAPLFVGGVAGLVGAVLLARRFGAFTIAWVSLLAGVPAGFWPFAAPWLGAPAYVIGQSVLVAGSASAALALLSLRQELTPTHLLGRTGGIVFALTSVAAMAVLYGQGTLVALVGGRDPMWIIAVVAPLALLPLLFVRRQMVGYVRPDALPVGGEVYAGQDGGGQQPEDRGGADARQ